uniref:TetR/AcrR family transcriptional regulator n=1 Tax=candidate division WOR-3 bacterium TaxID=2052148 RepID=A0A7V3ZZ40_UNCW3
MDTRERILIAARDVFGKKGFYETKMEDIAREAGVAKGTLYLYFQSKEELYQCLIKEGIKYFIHRLKEAIEVHDALEDKIRALIKTLILLIEENRDFIVRMVYEIPLVNLWNDRIKNAILEEQKEFTEFLKSLIEGSLKKGLIYEGNVDILSNALIGMVMRPIFNSFMNGTISEDIEEEVFQIVKRAFLKI